MKQSDKIREALRIVNILDQERQRLHDTYTVDTLSIANNIQVASDLLKRQLGFAVADEENL